MDDRDQSSQGCKTAVYIGTVIACFLLSTNRVPKAIEIFKECLILLSNKALQKRQIFVRSFQKIVYYKMCHGLLLIGDHTGVIEYSKKIIALHRLCEERAQEGKMKFTLATLYKDQCKYQEAEELYMQALYITRETKNRQEEAACCNALGTIYHYRADLVKAEEYFEKALIINKEIGDRRGEACCYANIGTVFQSLGKYVTAGEYLEKALVIHKEIGDRSGEACCYANIGTVFESLGKYVKAEEYLENALVIRKEIGDRSGEASCYANIGTVFQSLGKYVKAEEYLEKALVIRKEIGDRSGEAHCYANIGTVFQSVGKYVKAKEYLEKALVIRKEIGDRSGEADCYSNIGTVFESLGKYVKAEEYVEKALVIHKEIGDRSGEASCYVKIGTVFQSLGKYVKAGEYLEKALVIHKEIGDRRGEACCYANIGTVFESLGKYVKAGEYLEKALVIHKEIGDRRGEACCYANIGTVFESLGKYVTAEEYLEKALVIRKEIGDRSGEAHCYANIATVFESLGKYVKAKEYLEKALVIHKEIGDRRGEACCYANIGTVFQSLAKYVEAKEYVEKALIIHKEIGDRRGEASCYTNIGAVFEYLGKYVKAKQYLEKALVIRKEIGDRRGEAYCYANIGTVFQSLAKYVKAEEFLEKALVMRKEIGDRRGEAHCYRTLGNLFQSRGDVKAEDYQEKALEITKEIGDKAGEVGSYLALGSLAFCLAEYAKAKGYSKKALALSSDIGSIELQFQSHLRLATVALALENGLQELVPHLLESMKRSERIRSFLQEGGDELKISFLDNHASPYQLLGALYCFSGNDRDALYIAELGRARALADIMSQQYSVEQQISHEPQSWVGIETIMTKQNNCACLYVAYYRQSLFLWIIKPNKTVVFRRNDRLHDCLSDGDASPFVDDIFAEESFRTFPVLSIQEHCEDRSLPVPSKVSCLTCESSQKDGTEVSRLIEDDEDANLRPEPPSLSQCYQMIIAPVADLLDQPEIIIVPDRALYKVPFAALKDENGKYLSEAFRIRIVPSLTTLKLIQDSPTDYHSQTGALIVGDPDVGEVIFKGSLSQWKPLPCARKEAEMIGRLVGAQALLGQNATKKAVLESIQSVSLVHFAAHGDAERGEIALAPPRPFAGYPQEVDYLVTMAEISRIRLRAKLVVLSCCHSARGEIRSEGVVGIARAFLASGARAVLVALWAIDDEATEQFMGRFYENLVRGESASECLHQGMKWMRSNGFTDELDWAPFMLIGDNVTFNFV